MVAVIDFRYKYFPVDGRSAGPHATKMVAVIDFRYKYKHYYRHPQQAADLSAKVTKRIGCALEKDVLSRLDGAVLLVEFLVRKSWSIFMSPFHERELLQPVHQPIKWNLNVLPACEPIRLRCILPTVATCKIKVGWFREFCRASLIVKPFPMRWKTLVAVICR